MTLIGATQVAQIEAGPDQVHMRLLATTDLHAHLLPYDYYVDRHAPGLGLALLADLIVAARSSAPNTLLFDNGDTLQGTPLADTVLTDILPMGRPNPMISAMNALGYDAGTLGNHDFDFGLDYLQNSLNAAKFPVVLANAHAADGTPFLAPRALLNRDVRDSSGRKRALRIGVTGAVPPQVAAWSRRNVEGHLAFSDIASAIEDQARALRAEGADLIIALAHSGLGQRDAGARAENASRKIAALPEVDVVIAGHTHDLVAQTGGPDCAPIVQPAAYGTHLGIVDLVLSPNSETPNPKWQVRTEQVVNVATPVRLPEGGHRLRRVLAPFPALRQEVAQAHRTTRSHVDSPLGQTDVPLETLFSVVAPCAATQLVADAQRAAVAPLLAARPDLSNLPVLSAAAPFRAGGRAGPENYTDIPKGALKLRHAADLYIYPNALCVLRLDGAGLLDWLERSASIYNRIDPAGSTPQRLIDHSYAPYNFDRITGLRYQIDISQPARTDAEGGSVDPAASRVRDVRFADGRPVRPDDQMLIITNSYRAAGGGHMSAAAAAETVLASSHSVRDVVAQHMADSPVALNPRVEPTFAFAPLGGVELIFETGPAALSHSARLKELGLKPLVMPSQQAGFSSFLLRV